MIWTTGQLPCLAYRAMLASFLNKIIFSLGCVGKKEIVPNLLVVHQNVIANDHFLTYNPTPRKLSRPH